MLITRRPLFLLIIFYFSSLSSSAQDTLGLGDSSRGAGNGLTGFSADCRGLSSSLLLNSDKESDGWEIVSGPVLKGVHYPVRAFYTKPFPSWEMDRYNADSSYFKDCEWMVLPDKRTVVNISTRIPIVFIKKFTTAAPSQFKLIVKMLYDNMAYLYIDGRKIMLNHRNADINRFIQKLQPEFSGFISIPATFNFSYNASFYAGDVYGLTLPAGDHVIKVELYNNAYELGCIIKGMLVSDGNKKIFCNAPIPDEPARLESILLYRNLKAFPENVVTDSLYAVLMRAVKSSRWINNLLPDERDLIGNDTLFLKKGEKINISPAFITSFYNGGTDTVYASGSLNKIGAGKTGKKLWNKNFVFNAVERGSYRLEISCESPADAVHTAPGQRNEYSRVIRVK